MHYTGVHHDMTLTVALGTHRGLQCLTGIVHLLVFNDGRNHKLLHPESYRYQLVSLAPDQPRDFHLQHPGREDSGAGVGGTVSGR